MWQAMRQAALLARLTSGRPDVASATEVLRAATIEGARALGLGDRIGSVEVGKQADLVLVDLAAPHLTPVHDVPRCSSSRPAVVTSPTCSSTGAPSSATGAAPCSTPTTCSARPTRGDVARAAVEAL